MNTNRVIGLDVIRGLAVFFMVIFHLCFDLDYFKFINIDMIHGIFWKNRKSSRKP